MIAIVSQAWTLDAGAEADAYVAGWEDFATLLDAEPGYRGRVVLRDTGDPTHFTNIRYFDRLEDYETLIHRPGYAERIDALGTHLQLETPPVKQVADVVLRDGVS